MMRRTILGFLVGFFTVSSSCSFWRARARPMTLVVAEDTEGWFAIVHGVADAPQLPVEQGRRLVRLSSPGVSRTRSPLEYGILDLRVERPSGQRVPSLLSLQLDQTAHEATSATPFHNHWGHGEMTPSGGPRITYQLFYVGRGPSGEPPDALFDEIGSR